MAAHAVRRTPRGRDRGRLSARALRAPQQGGHADDMVAALCRIGDERDVQVRMHATPAACCCVCAGHSAPRPSGDDALMRGAQVNCRVCFKWAILEWFIGTIIAAASTKGWWTVKVAVCVRVCSAQGASGRGSGLPRAPSLQAGLSAPVAVARARVRAHLTQVFGAPDARCVLVLHDGRVLR